MSVTRATGPAEEPLLSAALRPGLFVGRRRELELLSRLLELSALAAHSAYIEGETGIGKSALVAEFLERTKENNARVLLGCSYQAQEAGPYFPFFQVLSQASSGGSPPQDILEGLTARESGGRNASRLSEDVRGQRAHFLRRLADTILREAGGKQTILCLEDIQWADVGSLLLVNHLLDLRPAGMLIVCTVRTDEPIEAEARQLLARIEQKSSRVVLRGLGRHEAAEFVRSIGGGDRITEDELQALRSFTNGNPLFLRELFLHLHQTGLLDRHSVREAIARSRAPDRLTHVVDLRLRSLPKAVNRALAAGSVIGGDFSAEMVSLLLGEPLTGCKEMLDSAVGMHVLLPVDRLATPRYRFAHPIFAMRLYDMLPPSTRRKLHRNIPQAGASADSSLTIEELARHYALGHGARNGLEAAIHCEAAAESAESVLAYETAARFWELALSCTPPRPRRTRANLARRLGWALWAAGKWAQAAEAWAQAVELFEGLEEWEPVGELALALGDVLRWRQELEPAEHWLGRAADLLPAGSEDRSRALALLGSIRCLRDEPEPGLRLLEEASESLADGKRDPLVAYWLAFGFLTSGNSSRGYEVAQDGLAEAQRRGNAQAACLLAGFLANHELNQLHGDAAWSYLRIVQKHVDPGDTTALIRSLVCEAWLAGYAGKWHDVIRLCEHWTAQVRLAGRYQVATASVVRGEAKLALGDAAGAAEEISLALPDLERMQAPASLHLARALLELGQGERVVDIVHRYRDQVMRLPRHATGRALLGDILSSLDEPDLQQECYEVLRNEMRPMVVVFSPISVQRVLGRLAGRLKRWDAAIEHFETARKQLAEGGARWELAQTLLNYTEMRRARRRRGDPGKAVALQLEADALLQELGIERTAAAATYQDGNRFDLTGRELEVLSQAAEGRRNQEIAKELTLSPRTVERHLENIFVKMQVNTRTEAVVLAVQEGLVGPLNRP